VESAPAAQSKCNKAKRRKVSDIHWIPTDLTDAKPLNHRVNFDLALAFIRRMRFLSLFGEQRSRIIVAYHGTPAGNFANIEDTNLLVPRGASGSQGPKVKHGSLHGRGIYVATDFKFASAYGAGAKECFLCLAVPGRQYTTHPGDNGIPLKAGYDSHLAGHGGAKGALVFFHSDQQLPCFLVNRSNYKQAAIQAQQLADRLSKFIRNIPETEAACSLQDLDKKKLLAQGSGPSQPPKRNSKSMWAQCVCM